ncbi:unnamed protein product [Macrosiphum euphorbiae]|uniref:Uncharacterized protein n=1 Tax=Macrosiphum euphorbiae TaxID=13131 RepID=A0AAV0W8W7_9HEMI|nr:unnamed protein product [Macrosiphum euphorbiae]
MAEMARRMVSLKFDEVAIWLITRFRISIRSEFVLFMFATLGDWTAFGGEQTWAYVSDLGWMIEVCGVEAGWSSRGCFSSERLLWCRQDTSGS